MVPAGSFHAENVFGLLVPIGVFSEDSSSVERLIAAEEVCRPELADRNDVGTQVKAEIAFSASDQSESCNLSSHSRRDVLEV